MVVHTFSKTNEWLAEYQHFISQFGLEAEVDEAVSIKTDGGISLSFAWIHGAEMYLEA